jgi:hypothetical protein
MFMAMGMSSEAIERFKGTPLASYPCCYEAAIYGHVVDLEGDTPVVMLVAHQHVGVATDGSEWIPVAAPISMRMTPEDAYQMMMSLLQALVDAEEDTALDLSDFRNDFQESPPLPSHIANLLMKDAGYEI